MRMSVDPEGRLIYERGQENLADGLHDHGTGKFVRESAHTTDDAEARKVPALHMTEITFARFTVTTRLCASKTNSIK